MKHNSLISMVSLIAILALGFTVKAQSPGGVATNLQLWLKAESLPGADGSSVANWASSVGSYAVSQTTAAQQPILYKTTATKLVNFNPAVYFDGSDGFGLRNTARLYSNTAAFSLLTVGVDQRSGDGLRATMGIGNDGNYPGLDFQVDGVSPNGWNPYMAFSSPSEWTGGSARVSTYSPGNMQGNVAALTSNNSVGGTNNIISYVNGYKEVTTLDANQNTQIGNGVYIGSSFDAPYQGLIPEAIAYDQQLSDTDMQKVQSYLAIKYGITLGQSFTTAAGLNSQNYNYVAANGSVIWNATGNAGYNYNIAGIARDDAQGLIQKQSMSVNSGRQVLISTTGLANTNLANSGTLTNEQYLVWGDNNLAKAPTVAISGIAGVNYHFASIWKVSNTNGVGTVRVAWPKGYTNFKLIQSSDATIDASDNVTDMASVQTINGIDYAYADVTLSDGQYFTFAAFVQGPGGVTNNLSYWYRADKLVASTGVGADVTSWTDFTSGTVSDQLGSNALPVSAQGSSTYFNFNPGIKFTSAAQTLGNINVQTVTSLNYDLFTLTKEGIVPGGNGRVFSSLINNADLNGNIAYWDGIGINAGQSIERVNTAYNYRYLANPGGVTYATNGPSIMYNKFTDVDVAKGLNGAPNGSPGTHIPIGQFNGGHAFGSTQFSSNGSDNAGFIGDIGELIIYGNGNITAAERNKVDTYLAIKYGITLNNSNDYTTSQNTVVWSATANAGYYNNVAGVGTDNGSVLEQKQSRSQLTNTNNQVTMGLGVIAATNVANPNSVSDGQFLVWGDNGNTQSLTTAFTSFTYAGNSNSRRMNRVWKVQNTSVGNSMLIRFPVASVGTTTLAAGDACAQYAIIYASDAAFTSNVSVQLLTTNGTDYEATHSFPAGASYFTYGKVVLCSVTISGTVFNDANGGTIDGTPTNVVAGNTFYVSTTGPTTGIVISTTAVQPDGTYSLTASPGTSYSVVLTNVPQTVGSPISNTGLTGAVYTAEGTTPAGDGTPDGKTPVTTGTTSVTGVNFGIKAVPDLTPLIYARPSTVYNTTNMTVVVDVFELLGTPSSGLITVQVTKDARMPLSFSPTATTIDGRSVQNGLWTIDASSNASYYILTTSSVVAAGDKLSFGFTGQLIPGATTGAITVSAGIVGGSGGEVRLTNNTDADKIDYFQQ